MKKRILSLLLALVMVVTLLPTAAIATEVDTGTDGGLTDGENIDAPPSCGQYRWRYQES